MRHSFDVGSWRRSGRRVLERLEVRGKPAPGSVEANPTCDVRAAERARGFGERKLLPRDQAQNLAVGFAENSKRTSEHRVADELGEIARLAVAGRDPVSRRRPALVRQRLSSHRVEPRQRLVRHAIQLAPADEEGFGHEVLDGIGLSPPPDVRRHGIDVARVDVLKSLVRRPLHLTLSMSSLLRVLQGAAPQYAREMASGSSFIPDVEAWDPWRPDQVAVALASVQARWAVAGGWALDLRLGAVTRPHEDIEIVVSRNDVHGVLAHLSDLEWFVVGDGRAWPLATAPQGLHQTWGRDRSGDWRLDVLQEPWDDGEWVCRRDPRIRRPLAEAIELSPGGIPYLAPEIVLLFKAKAAREKDEADFALTLPSLTADRVTWLREALRIVHPGHEWLSRLTITS